MGAVTGPIAIGSNSMSCAGGRAMENLAAMPLLNDRTITPRLAQLVYLLDSIARMTAAYQRKTPAARRQDLIAAAIAWLGRGGMQGFTIDAIRRQAGV